ncbi:hypothetical protein [Peribacillus loiseleuriae]|uniref:hypothetical protein n=1 Tax=Peribacillus loiseleuriae TaxID=1679170 RepID=UPI003D03553D
MKYLRVIIYMCMLGIIYPKISFAETNGDVPFLINNGKCPNLQELEHVISNKGLTKALNTIIPGSIKIKIIKVGK